LLKRKVQIKIECVIILEGEKMKVVINKCFGGFGLSELAQKEYLKRKVKKWTKKEKADFYDRDVDRADPDLVAVVEKLGDKANGWAADLKVVDIPDKVKYIIDDYDGVESIHEAHEIWD
jgi:hypothetical protein